MPSPETWRHVQSPVLGLMATVAEQVQLLELRGELRLEPFRSRTCYVTSDYGGQHAASRFQTYSFLFCDLGNAQQWLHRKVRIRERYLPEGRRLGYKEMSDGHCREAFFPFLDAADQLPGVVFTLAIDKQIPTLFGDPADADQREWIVDPGVWKAAVFERVLRVVHFASLLPPFFPRQGRT
jgi:hypothetical protein